MGELPGPIPTREQVRAELERVKAWTGKRPVCTPEARAEGCTAPSAGHRCPSDRYMRCMWLQRGTGSS